jgi:type II secretory pathway component GspD/PulD (secretin)
MAQRQSEPGELDTLHMRIFAGWFLVLLLLVSRAVGQENSGADLVSLNITDQDAQSVVRFYAKLTKLNVIQGNSAPTKITVVADSPVSREKAIDMIEQALFQQNFAIVQVDSDTVEIVGSGQNPRKCGVPVLFDAKDLPGHERVVSLLYTFKYADAQSMQQLIGHSLMPPRPYTSFLAFPDINALMVTERTSNLRDMIHAMEKADVPNGKTGATGH